MDVHERVVAPADWCAEAAALATAGATMLDFLTAVDEPADGEIELVLHLVDVDRRARHLLRTRVPREQPHVDSLVDVHRGAAWHEREVHELFGVIFDGNPDLRPLLTDGSADRPLLRTTALPRRVATPWPGSVDPADRPAAAPGCARCREGRGAATFAAATARHPGGVASQRSAVRGRGAHLVTGHARIALIADNCTSCMLCVRECPTWCITLQAHQETVGDPAARRPRTVNVLDDFAIDWGLCMYCGICVEVCPFEALEWRGESVPATSDPLGLHHGIPELRPDRP